MATYRPRPVEIKQCQHCKITFESRHKRTLYCCSSCRTLAYNLRHEMDFEPNLPASSPKTNLDFSAHNVAVTGLGALGANLLSAALSDDPIQKQLTKLANQITINHSEVKAQLAQQGDFIEAVKKDQPSLGWSMNTATKERQLKVAKKEALQAKAQRMLAKRKSEHRFG